MDINLIDNHVRYKFADSPVLTVSIFETQVSVIILVVTVSSLHRLTFSHPCKLQQKMETQSLSIFHETSANSTRDTSKFHVIGNLTATSMYTALVQCTIQFSKIENVCFRSSHSTYSSMLVVSKWPGSVIRNGISHNPNAVCNELWNW